MICADGHQHPVLAEYLPQPSSSTLVVPRSLARTERTTVTVKHNEANKRQIHVHNRSANPPSREVRARSFSPFGLARRTSIPPSALISHSQRYPKKREDRPKNAKQLHKREDIRHQRLCYVNAHPALSCAQSWGGAREVPRGLGGRNRGAPASCPDLRRGRCTWAPQYFWPRVPTSSRDQDVCVVMRIV